MSGLRAVAAVLAVFAALCGAAYLYIGLCVVIVHNTGASSVTVKVGAAGEHLGTATLAPGERMRRTFYPKRDGEIDVTCIDNGKTHSGSFGYVTGGENVVYRVEIQTCSAMSETDERLP